jgi:hypothetical protein
MKITHNGQDYELDIEKAKACGAIQYAALTSFKVGDVFCSSDSASILITSGYDDGTKERTRYHMAGLDGLKPYSDFGTEGATKDKMLEYLNRRKFRLMGNINNKVADIIAEFKRNFK